MPMAVAVYPARNVILAAMIWIVPRDMCAAATKTFPSWVAYVPRSAASMMLTVPMAQRVMQTGYAGWFGKSNASVKTHGTSTVVVVAFDKLKNATPDDHAKTDAALVPVSCVGSVKETETAPRALDVEGMRIFLKSHKFVFLSLTATPIPMCNVLMACNVHHRVSVG